jgi:hypothetical protein
MMRHENEIPQAGGRGVVWRVRRQQHELLHLLSASGIRLIFTHKYPVPNGTLCQEPRFLKINLYIT